MALLYPIKVLLTIRRLDFIVSHRRKNFIFINFEEASPFSFAARSHKILVSNLKAKIVVVVVRQTLYPIRHARVHDLKNVNFRLSKLIVQNYSNKSVIFIYFNLWNSSNLKFKPFCSPFFSNSLFTIFLASKIQSLFSRNFVPTSLQWVHVVFNISGLVCRKIWKWN